MQAIETGATWQRGQGNSQGFLQHTVMRLRTSAATTLVGLPQECPLVDSKSVSSCLQLMNVIVPRQTTSSRLRKSRITGRSDSNAKKLKENRRRPFLREVASTDLLMQKGQWEDQLARCLNSNIFGRLQEDVKEMISKMCAARVTQ